MHPAEYTGLGIFMVSILGFMYRVNKGNEKKVSYQSFDRYKKEIKEEYVETKMCDLTHKHVKETLERLETGQGKIFDLIKNGKR